MASRAELARPPASRRTTVSPSSASWWRPAWSPSAPASASRRNQGGRPPALVTLDRSAGAAIGIDFGKRHLARRGRRSRPRVLAERCARDCTSTTRADRRWTPPPSSSSEALGARRTVDRDRVLGVGHGPARARSTARPAPSARRPSSRAGPASRAAEAIERAARACPCASTTTPTSARWPRHVWGAGRGRRRHRLPQARHRHRRRAWCSTAACTAAPAAPPARSATRSSTSTGPSAAAATAAAWRRWPPAPRCSSCCAARSATDLTLDRVVELASEGDPACRRVVADAGRHIGRAVANLVNLLNPERIVVGGELAAAGDVLLEPLREAVPAPRDPSAADDVEIVPGVAGRPRRGARRAGPRAPGRRAVLHTRRPPRARPA